MIRLPERAESAKEGARAMETGRQLICGIALLLAVALPAPAAAAPANVHAEFVGTFQSPVQVVSTPDDPDLVFVVERGGRVRVIDDGVRLPGPFLDIADLVYSPTDDPGAGGEQGLLSIAFAPDYARSRRFYVLYTTPGGSLAVDEFRRAQSHLRADPATRRVVMRIPHPDTQNHYGGKLEFGPDGHLLYISTGDGGTSPVGENSRRLDNLLGKILRINPLPGGDRSYTIPAGNPFVGRAGRDEIFAYGLRNPWRFAFDGGRLAIADVGMGSWEEVDFLPVSAAAGANFGWPAFEGFARFATSRPGPDPPTFPIHVYGHGDGACSITGGLVSHDPNLTGLEDRYVYGDFCTGEVRSFRPILDGGAYTALNDTATGVVAPWLTSFGEAANGDIYLTQLGGRVSRLEPGRG